MRCHYCRGQDGELAARHWCRNEATVKVLWQCQPDCGKVHPLNVTYYCDEHKDSLPYAHQVQVSV